MSLKRKNMKIISLAAAVILGISMVSTVSAVDAASKNTKDETVYVITDSEGNQDEIIVSDHIINKTKSKELADVSPLKNIENVKGKEKFLKTGDENIRWKADENDIYYQGDTDKTAPVTMEIKYYLNGKQVKGEELKDKSGKLKISIEYKNNQQVVVAGNTVNVPFTAITGMIIENDCLKNISVSNGKVIDDGDKQFIALMAMPGLTESLGKAGTNLGFSDKVEITGDAEKFKISDIMTVVTNDVFRDINMDEFGELDLDEQINQLEKAAKTLNKGTLDLYNGINTLSTKSGDMAKGVKKLSEGAKKLSDGTKEAVKGSDALAGGAEALAESVNEELIPGVEQLAAGSSAAASGAKQIADKVGSAGSADSSTLVGGAAQLSVGLNGNGTAENPGLKNSYANVVAYSEGTVNQTIAMLETLKSSGAITEEQYNQIDAALNQSVANQKAVQGAVNKLADGAGAMYAGTQALAQGINGDGTSENPGLVNGVNAVAAGTQQLLGKLQGTADNTQSLAAGSKSLSEGTAQLAAGQKELNSGAKMLSENMQKLDSSTGKLISGVKALNGGAFKLQRGMNKFYNEGIKKIVELYNSDLKGVTNDLDQIVKAGKQYRIFTDVSRDMDSSVKFIYKTEVMSQD